jgi:hypothetical protein
MRIVSLFLAILLAAPPLLPAAPQAPPADTPLAVVHSGVECMVANTNPQLDAGIAPTEQVQAGRVYFKSVLGDAYYYVEMTSQGGRYVGVLPKPRLDAGPITYYVEGVGRDYSQAQTSEQRSLVVEKQSDCGNRPAAAIGPDEPVRVFSVGGGTALPPGFSGVSSVVAAGTSAAGPAVVAAAGGGGISTTGLIIAGAVAVGVVAAVIVTTRDDDGPPASPSR